MKLPSSPRLLEALYRRAKSEGGGLRPFFADPRAMIRLRAAVEAARKKVNIRGCKT
jgi:hypothetical protein